MVGAVFLAACALRGPGLFWLEFWTAPVVRSLLVTVIVALLLWTLAGGWGVARRFSGSAPAAGRFRGSIWATGSVLAGLGAMLVAVGVVPAVAGLETMLTGLNNEMAILPMGLSMILGITTHLGIPTSLPVTIMTAGGALLVLGGVVLVGRAWWCRRTLTAAQPATSS